MADQTLTCVDCKKPFEWTESEQAFYAKKLFKTPKRCKACRDSRKKAYDKRATDCAKDDKKMTCGTCSKIFVWTKREQDFYEKSEFTPPKHCATCRAKRKVSRKKNKRRGSRRDKQPERAPLDRTDARAYLR